MIQFWIEFCRLENIVYVDRGNSAILFCNVTPKSWPTWDGPGINESDFLTYADKFNINSKLQNAHKIEIVGNISAGEYNLKLNDISSKEEGFYRCTEYVNEGTPLQTTIVTLTIKGILRYYFKHYLSRFIIYLALIW